MFIDSVKITQNCVQDHEYKTILQTLNEKHEEFWTHYPCSYNQTTASTVLSAWRSRHRKITCHKSTIPWFIQVIMYKCWWKPRYIENKFASTSKAAYNVKDSTIHAAFNIPANQKLQCIPLGPDKQKTLWVQYAQLEWLLADGLSMIGKNMVYFMDSCLQEIKFNKRPFEGISVIAIGDLYQLKPVQDGYIFQPLQNDYGPLATKFVDRTFLNAWMDRNNETKKTKVCRNSKPFMYW